MASGDFRGAGHTPPGSPKAGGLGDRPEGLGGLQGGNGDRHLEGATVRLRAGPDSAAAAAAAACWNALVLITCKKIGELEPGRVHLASGRVRPGPGSGTAAIGDPAKAAGADPVGLGE